MWYHGARLTRRGWVSQPVGRGDLSPTRVRVLNFGALVHFVPARQYAYSW